MAPKSFAGSRPFGAKLLFRHADQALPTVKRLEAKPGNLAAHASTVAALVRALEAAGIEFTNGEQPGVRLAKAAAARSAEPASASNPTAAAKAPRRKAAKATEKKR